MLKKLLTSIKKWGEKDEKKLTGVIIFILVLSLALMGCSSSKSNSEKSSDGKKDSSDGGGVLVYARGGDAVKLDPATVTDGESLIVAEQIFETLVNFKRKQQKLSQDLQSLGKSLMMV